MDDKEKEKQLLELNHDLWMERDFWAKLYVKESEDHCRTLIISLVIIFFQSIIVLYLGSCLISYL